ncbi:MAG: hypothetical protein KGQ75_00245 [Sphingomonadales bacterium]|nr:hypothetical protein [Sphingomonadales bacterium]
MVDEQNAVAVAKRYKVRTGQVADVTAARDGTGGPLHQLPAGTTVVCAQAPQSSGRIRISSPAGWVDPALLEPAPAAPSLRLEYDVFQERHTQVAPGDAYGLEFPFSLAMLEEYGPEWLTRAFQASGIIGPDNRVISLGGIKPIEVMGASENALFTIAYEKPEAHLETELFIKMPPADTVRKFGLTGMSHGEVEIARLSQKGIVPVETAPYYFADYCTHTGNYILITGKIAFGVDPIEPAHRKGFDFRVPAADEHYQVLTTALARVVAAHKTGAMGLDIEDIFPYPRGARDFWQSAESAGRIDRLVDFIGRIAPQLFIKEGTDPAFLQRWREDLLFGLANKDAVIGWLHADPDYTGLCHSNLNIDNAWYWRDADGKLQVGLLDWGGVGQMSIGQALSSMLMMPEPEAYIDLARNTIDRFIADYQAAGGIELSAEKLRFHYKASVFSTAIWIIVDYITDMLFQFPEESWAAMANRFDDQLTGTGLYSAIIWIDNMLRDWLDDLTPGEACRRIVAGEV